MSSQNSSQAKPSASSSESLRGTKRRRVLDDNNEKSPAELDETTPPIPHPYLPYDFAPLAAREIGDSIPMHGNYARHVKNYVAEQVRPHLILAPFHLWLHSSHMVPSR